MRRRHHETIICGTDLSPAAEAGLDAAAALAQRMGEDLALAHVLEPGVRIGAETGEGIELMVGAALETAASSLERRSGVRASTQVVTGSAWKALAELAEKREASLLVVASRGHGESSLFRTGSTSERVAQAARIPVLIVHDASPFVAWARDEKPLRVFLGIDGETSSRVAIRWVKTLREAGPCDLVVGHIYRGGEARQTYGLRGGASLLDADPEAERLLARDLEHELGTIPGSGSVTYPPRVGLGRLGDHLLDLAQAQPVDLIVLGTHRYRGFARFSSVPIVAMHYSPISIAVVPARMDEPVAPLEAPQLRVVVIATDLSAFGDYAVPFGYSLLAAQGGEVHLVHVVQPGWPKEREGRALAQLRSLIENREAAPRLDVHTHVVERADVASAILSLAASTGADAICMASHARSGLGAAILGTTSLEVLARTKKPVLLVHPPRK